MRGVSHRVGETSRTAGPLRLETEYDVVGRVTRQHCADSTRSQLVYERRYQWDRADQIIREMLTDGAPTGPGEKYRQSLWGYDAAGRLTQSHQPGSEEHFWYDGADNQVQLAGVTGGTTGATVTLANTGGTTPLPTISPQLVLKACIAWQGYYPIRP